jgi:hypothetical protein
VARCSLFGTENQPQKKKAMTKRKLEEDQCDYSLELHREWVRKRCVIQSIMFNFWHKEDIHHRSFEKQRELYLRKFYRWCQTFQAKVCRFGGVYPVMNPILRYPLRKVLEEPYLPREQRTPEPLEEDPEYTRLFSRSTQGPAKRLKSQTKPHCVRVQSPVKL